MSSWHWFVILTVAVVVLGGLAFLAACCFVIWNQDEHKGVDL